jgi:Transcriptional regulator
MTVSKKELIMEAAYDSFVDKGYENTNIRQICKAVDVEPPTVYYYFESKKNLFFAVAKSIHEKYDRLIIAENILEKPLEPYDKLFQLFHFNLYYSKNNPKDVKFTLRYDLFPPGEIAEELVEFNRSHTAVKTGIENKIFEECVKKGVFPTSEVESIKKLYFTFVSKYCYYSVLFGYCPSFEEIIKIWNSFMEDKLK